MPIGTSDGQTFNDEWEYAINALNEAMPSSEKMKFFDTSSINDMMQPNSDQPTYAYQQMRDNPFLSGQPSTWFLKQQEAQMNYNLNAHDHSGEGLIGFSRPEQDISIQNQDVKPLPVLPSIEEEHAIEMNRVNTDATKRAIANTRRNSSGTQSK